MINVTSPPEDVNAEPSVNDRKGPRMQTIREIYQYRNILWALVRRNIVGKYKNSFLGFAWHFITPLCLIVLYYIVFTGIRTNPIESFWVYLGCAIFQFSFMSSNLLGGSGCILNNGGYISKMYFPREIVPLAQVTSSFIVMLFGYAVIMILTIVSGYDLNPVALLMLPAIFILNYIFVLGMVMLISSIIVYVKDIQHLLSSMSMVFFFTTPTFYLANETTGILSKLIWINPFTYYVEAYHDMVYFGVIPGPEILIACVALAIAFLAVGAVVFKRLKRGFVERL